MTEAFILAPITLAVVLIVSGVAKLRDRDAAAEAFDNLKVPALLAQPWLRTALPWVELALGIALLVLPSVAGLLGTLAAVALFAAYLVLIVRAYRRGSQANCNCFGALTSGRISGWTVARNAILVVLSVLAVLDNVLSAGAPVTRAFDSALPWVLMIALVGLLAYAIIHEPQDPDAPAASTPPNPADDGEYVRVPSPFAVLVNHERQLVTLASLTRERAALLIWVSFGCGPCTQILAKLPEWRERLPRVDIHPVVGLVDSLDSAPDELKDIVLADPESSLGQAMHSVGTPTAVLFGADQMVGGGPVAGVAGITQLIDDMAEQLAAAHLDTPAPVEQPLPEQPLPEQPGQHPDAPALEPKDAPAAPAASDDETV